MKIHFSYMCKLSYNSHLPQMQSWNSRETEYSRWRIKLTSSRGRAPPNTESLHMIKPVFGQIRANGFLTGVVKIRSGSLMWQNPLQVCVHKLLKYCRCYLQVEVLSKSSSGLHRQNMYTWDKLPSILETYTMMWSPENTNI
jgi:hypothetical protein